MEAYHQYNEAEWMLPDDYDALIEDPSDFFFRPTCPAPWGPAPVSPVWPALRRVHDDLGRGLFAGWAQPDVLDSLMIQAAKDYGTY